MQFQTLRPRRIETVQHLLQAPKVCWIDALTGLETIAKHCRTHTVGQGCRLHLTAFATQQIPQDLSENVAHW